MVLTFLQLTKRGHTVKKIKNKKALKFIGAGVQFRGCCSTPKNGLETPMKLTNQPHWRVKK